MKKYLIIILMFFAGYANAGLITVEYQVNYPSSAYALSGTFSGNDKNSDGFLALDELDDWNTDYGGGFDISDLNDIGDFDYLNNNWLPNALGPDQYTEDAYISWNNWGSSVSTSVLDWVVTTSVTVQQVPAPSSLAILGLGIATLIGFHRRRRRT